MMPFGGSSGGRTGRAGRSRMRLDELDCADIMMKAVQRKRSRSLARRESFSGTEDDLKKFRDAVESNEKESKDLEKDIAEYALKVREIRGDDHDRNKGRSTDDSKTVSVDRSKDDNVKAITNDDNEVVGALAPANNSNNVNLENQEPEKYNDEERSKESSPCNHANNTCLLNQETENFHELENTKEKVSNTPETSKSTDNLCLQIQETDKATEEENMTEKEKETDGNIYNTVTQDANDTSLQEQEETGNSDALEELSGQEITTAEENSSRSQESDNSYTKEEETDCDTHVTATEENVSNTGLQKQQETDKSDENVLNTVDPINVDIKKDSSDITPDPVEIQGTFTEESTIDEIAKEQQCVESDSEDQLQKENSVEINDCDNQNIDQKEDDDHEIILSDIPQEAEIVQDTIEPVVDEETESIKEDINQQVNPCKNIVQDHEESFEDIVTTSSDQASIENTVEVEEVSASGNIVDEGNNNGGDFLSIVDRIKNDINTLKTISKKGGSCANIQSLVASQVHDVVIEAIEKTSESTATVVNQYNDQVNKEMVEKNFEQVDVRQAGLKVALDRIHREKSTSQVFIPKELSSHLINLSSSNISEELRKSCSNIVAHTLDQEQSKEFLLKKLEEILRQERKQVTEDLKRRKEQLFGTQETHLKEINVLMQKHKTELNYLHENQIDKLKGVENVYWDSIHRLKREIDLLENEKENMKRPSQLISDVITVSNRLK